MIKFLTKIYVLFLLKRKFFKKFIIKSYNKITIDKDLYSDYFRDFETRYNKDYIYALADEELINTKINQKNYNNIYFLTNIDCKINSQNIKNHEMKKIETTENLKKEEINNSIFFTLFASDDLALPHIKNIIENKGFFKCVEYDYGEPSVEFSRATSYRFTNNNCLEAIKKTFDKKKKKVKPGYHRALIITHENICEGLEITMKVRLP